MTLPAVFAVSLAPITREGPWPSRFHIAALAFQRAQQLKLGARPRVDALGHKVVTIAVLEVLADTVSWSNQ